MSIESLTSILISAYKSAIFRKYFPGEVLIVKPWEAMLSDVLTFFRKTEADVLQAMQTYEYKDGLEDPMVDIIEYVISVFIAEEGHTGNLWDNIVTIEEVIPEKGDCECVCCNEEKKENVSYEIKIKSKEDILDSCSPEWVWKNYDEVCSFMSNGNFFYKSLTTLAGKSYDILYKQVEG